MDVDIEVDTQPDTGTIQQEAFTELMQLVGMSPVYQQQISLKQLIQLSPIPHKRSVLDSLAQAEQAQQQASGATAASRPADGGREDLRDARLRPACIRRPASPMR